MHVINVILNDSFLNVLYLTFSELVIFNQNLIYALKQQNYLSIQSTIDVMNNNPAFLFFCQY